MRLLYTNPYLQGFFKSITNENNTESIVNDLSINLDDYTLFLNWYDDTIGVYPVWVCPYHTARDTFFVNKGEYAIDFGIGFAVSKQYDFNLLYNDPNKYKKMIDHKMYEMKRKKGLYSTTILTCDQFQELYNPDGVYDELKVKYDPYNKFPRLYDKICKNR